jgi:hypothetical protein
MDRQVDVCGRLDATLRSVLDALSRRIDGGPAAATTMYRKRAVFYNALGYAVERKVLPTNPIDQIQWSAPEVAETVDRRGRQSGAGEADPCGSSLARGPRRPSVRLLRRSLLCPRTSGACGDSVFWLDRDQCLDLATPATRRAELDERRGRP